MTTVTYGYDITADNYPGRPSYGQACLYLTGNGIAATPQMRAAHPTAVLIDQSPNITVVDMTADWFDCENGALTIAQLPAVIHDAWDAYEDGARPGQRKPAVYTDASNAAAVAEALEKGGAPASTGLVIAHWGIGQSAAVALIGTRMGGFPLVGVQYASMPMYDLDVIDSAWLAGVSVKPAAVKAEVPPGQWLNPAGWSWSPGGVTMISGTGLDGDHYEFDYNTATGKWDRAV